MNRRIWVPGTTDLLALENSGQLRPQIRIALERAGITDLEQLQGMTRSELGLLPGIGEKSTAEIDAAMREAGLAPLGEGKPRR
jgi:hypothetical protein